MLKNSHPLIQSHSHINLAHLTC